MSNPTIAFGIVLRKLRLEADQTQEQLSEKADLDTTYISQLENGHRSPTLGTIFDLAQALNISSSELIHLVEIEQQNPSEFQRNRSRKKLK